MKPHLHLLRCVAVLALAAAAVACDTSPADYRFGENLTGLRFELFDDTEGIHPSKVVLENERNPFRNVAIGAKTKFEILSEGGNAGAFYAWATLLARSPTGEHQFYASQKLADIFATDEAAQEDQATVREMAIAGFQSVLDNFPDSVTFDATGTQSFRLATPAYKGIVALGGRVAGGWILVTTADGGQEAVRGNPGGQP